MSIWQSIILGIVQGLTEFLPISSSAHLVLTPYLLGWHFPEDEAFVFDVLVQIPSVLAVVIYFWRDLVEIAAGWLRGLWERRPFATQPSRMGWLLILATIPAGLIGLLLKDAVESTFAQPLVTGAFLWITAGLLILAEWAGKRTRGLDQLTWKDALWIGAAQAISIFSGISRSGSTMAGGMTRDLQRPAAARFAFLMAVPIMTAAGLLAAADLTALPNLGRMLPVFLPGFLASGVVSYIAIRWLIHYVAKHPLWIFALYCLIFGGIVMVVDITR
jgi:undecaprenyl-diphosphatase